MLDRLRFDGARVVVTGAGSGIGRASCRVLDELGAQVILVGRTESSLEETAADLTNPYEIVPADVTDERSVADLAQRVTAGDRGVRAVINNAGTNFPKNILELSLDDWERLMAVDLTSIFLMARAFLPALIEQDGRGAMVNMSSTFGLMGFPDVPVYSAARGGVISLTRQLAVDFGPRGVRVNAVCPGPTLSPRVEGYLAREEVDSDRLRRSVPLERFATCDEVANVIAFLASDAASFVHGAIVTVDGGQTSF